MLWFSPLSVHLVRAKRTNSCGMSLPSDHGRNLSHLRKTKPPVHIVFGVVTNNDDMTPPFIFPFDLRLFMEAYIKCLEEVVLLRIKKVTV